MHNRNPLSSLLAAAMIGALLDPALAKRPAAPTTKPEQPTDFLPLDLSFFGVDLAGSQEADRPAERTIAQVCAIPLDIADRCGMNAPGFDPQSMTGRTTALLAAALSNLRELKGLCTPEDKAKCQMADQSIGAAVAALDIIKPTSL